MTRPYSDATLDALAAAPEYGLRWLIIDLRRAFMYTDDVPDRIHQRHTSKAPDDEVDAKGWPMDTDEGGVGLPFHSKMHRYLRTNAGRSSTHQWDTGPDARVRPAMASIAVTSDWCHTFHTSHQLPLQALSLCAQLLFEIAWGKEPVEVASRYGLELQPAEEMLLTALRRAREQRIDMEIRSGLEPGTSREIRREDVVRRRAIA